MFCAAALLATRLYYGSPAADSSLLLSGTPCDSGQSTVSLNTPAVTKTFFLTSFNPKFEEVKKVLGSHSITQCFVSDLPTFEDMDLTQLAEKRVGLLYERLKKPCFLEECSLEIEDLQFPGHAFRLIQKNKKYMRQWARENCGKSGVIRIVVGYADSCGQVSSFETSARGTIAVPATEEGWNVGIGWDPIWAPEGFRGLTIAQMLPHKHFVDTRLQLYLSLREFLVRFEDNLVVYEVHLTMCLPTEAKSDLAQLLEFKGRFEEACVAESQRPLTVLEDHGEGKRQVQFQTAQYRCFEDVKSACEWARVLSNTLHEKHNCPVARMRVEGMAYSKATPKTKAEGRRAHPDAYFEFHLRLGVNVAPELVATARSIVAQHRNPHVDPHIAMVGVKSFLNCRFYAPVALEEADTKFDAIVAELVDRCHFEPKKKTLKEYCVYDDHVAFDEDANNPTVVQDAVFRGLQEHLLSTTFPNSSSPPNLPDVEPERLLSTAPPTA
jgi:inosine/xanthosine triphosphate pyrophosphatase family protein